MKFFHRYHIAGQSLHNPIQSAIYLTTLLLFLMLPLVQNLFFGGEPFILARWKSLLIDPWQCLFHS